MEKKKFDLVVLGTGSAASNVANKCNSAGWKVAVIDSRPYGGTCVLRGCDPKKVLVGTAEILGLSHRMIGKGISTENLHINWPDLIHFKNTFTDPVPHKREKAFEKAGIATYHGPARFLDRTSVEVGNNQLEGRYIVIATGAKPAPLFIPGENYLTSSTEFLDLKAIPPKIIFVGGGYISFEFAHIAARAGAQVSILHRGSKPLKGFEPDLVTKLQQASEDIGIKVHLNTTVKAIEKADNGLKVQTLAEGEDQVFGAVLVVHGAGRVPEIDELDLEKAEVEWGKNGVVVNDFLQSVTNPAVYAAGDAADSPGLNLTPIASLEGRVVGNNILKGNDSKANYDGTPTIVFTQPTLAAVGMKEETAKLKGINFKVKQGGTSDWYSSRRVGEKHSEYKVLVEEDTDRILGAHLLYPQAEEIINLFAMAIRMDIPARELKKMIYAYPTSASDIPYML